MTLLTKKIHSIDRLDHPFGMYITPYIVEETGPEDLTLVDTCFSSEFPKLVSHIHDEGYDVKNVKRLVLTHTHPDHVQAANELKRITGAQIYAHWTEAGFLRHEPPYHGPPNHQLIGQMMSSFGIREENVAKKFGSLTRDAVKVDHELSDGDHVGKLRVIHTPGHTPGHISLFSEEDRALIGGDFLLSGVLGIDGLYVPLELAIDPVVAVLSAKRISRLHFDKLLLAHQNSPLLDGSAPRLVERAATAVLLKEKNAQIMNWGN